MKRKELLQDIRALLDENKEIANEARGLKLLRLAYVELSTAQPATSNVPAPAAIPSHLLTTEHFAWDVFAELGLLPEDDGEPLATAEEALGAEPELPQRALDTIAAMVQADSGPHTAFSAAVRELLGVSPDASLDQLYGVLATKAQYLDGLEKGILERDAQLTREDAFLQRLCELAEIEYDNVDYLQARLSDWRDLRDRLIHIRRKLGIPDKATGTVEQLELANIQLCMDQRQAAWDRARSGRDEVPPEGTLESIIDRCLSILHLDWQDVETLPQEVQQLEQKASKLDDDDDDVVSGDVCLTDVSWIRDSIDLAHAVAGDLSPANRVMAKEAQRLIKQAPREV